MKFSIYFCLILTSDQLRKNFTTYPRVAKITRNESVFFLYLCFLSRTFTIHMEAGERGDIHLTPLYHFHPLHRNLDISRVITAESSSLHIASIVAGFEPETFGFLASTSR